MQRAKPKSVQYTLRGVPDFVDKALRAKARKEKKSLNQVAIEILRQAVAPEQKRRYTDLDEFIGTWVEDPEFDKAMEEQRQIDPEMWR